MSQLKRSQGRLPKWVSAARICETSSRTINLDFVTRSLSSTNYKHRRFVQMLNSRNAKTRFTCKVFQTPISSLSEEKVQLLENSRRDETSERDVIPLRYSATNLIGSTSGCWRKSNETHWPNGLQMRRLDRTLFACLWTCSASRMPFRHDSQFFFHIAAGFLDRLLSELEPQRRNLVTLFLSRIFQLFISPHEFLIRSKMSASMLNSFLFWRI